MMNKKMMMTTMMILLSSRVNDLFQLLDQEVEIEEVVLIVNGMNWMIRRTLMATEREEIDQQARDYLSNKYTVM